MLKSGEDHRLRSSQQEIAMSSRPGLVPDADARIALDAPAAERLTDGELADQLHDPMRHDAACAALVTRYQSIVNACARRYRLPAQYTEDLVQVGYVGLLKAINNFDPEVTPELAGYAHACVSGEIKRYFRDKRWGLRVRRSDQELLLKARAARSELAHELGRAPADAEVARYLQVTVEDLETADAAASAFAPASLDAELGGAEGLTLSDVLGAEDADLDRTVDLEALAAHWEELPRREQRILTLRFYGNKTQAEVAADVGCSQMHVSRLEARALRHLRQRLLEDEPAE
jgi:RNA polymerase sigma-B factor